jgi:5-methylcytosine-specific restriction endonuclease McrA
MATVQDLSGQRFHKLVVLHLTEKVHGRTAWQCQCDCGNLVAVSSNALKRSNTKSCGCLNHVKKLVDIDWNDPVSRNVRRRELYEAKVAAGYVRTRTEAYYAQKRKNATERYRNNKKELRAKGNEATKRWRQAHPEQCAASNAEMSHRWRAHKASAPLNDLTGAQWKEIKAAYGHRCVYCGRKMLKLTMDHITPLSKGGSHTVSNIVPACQSCNSAKNNRQAQRLIQPLLFTIASSKPMARNGEKFHN